MGSPPAAARARWRIAISGARGLIGGPLCRRLAKLGHQVLRLVRGEPQPREDEINWNPQTGVVDAEHLEGLDAVIHLAGENIGDGRWSFQKKQAIRDSRVRGTRLLAEALAALDRPPRVLISASATGYYGSRGDEELTEAAENGSGFLPVVCCDWEAAADPARAAGIRVVHPRFGVVLTGEGGALARMLPLFRMGLGGILGPGSQYLPWISIDDTVSGLLYLLANPELIGPVNLCAPHPVMNAEFTQTLAAVLGKRPGPHVPVWALKLFLGEMAQETVLASQRALPEKLLNAGFNFKYYYLEDALRTGRRLG